jgi:hypothetical protein
MHDIRRVEVAFEFDLPPLQVEGVGHVVRRSSGGANLDGRLVLPERFDQTNALPSRVSAEGEDEDLHSNLR